MHNKIESSVVFFPITEFAKLEKKRANGWYITYLSRVEGGYTFVLERSDLSLEADSVYIPPRKKIKIG